MDFPVQDTAVSGFSGSSPFVTRSFFHDAISIAAV
jgi:hypothetical protein